MASFKILKSLRSKIVICLYIYIFIYLFICMALKNLSIILAKKFLAYITKKKIP